MLVLVAVPLVGIDAAIPTGRPSASTLTGTGPGISLPQLLVGSAVALVILIPVALALGWFVAGRFLRPLRAIAGVFDSRRDQATERGIDLAERLTPAVTAGDPRLIESLVANLIDNAIRHNHPDGHIKITTQTSGPQVAFTVTNSGPVILDDQIQRLFHPFQKLAPDRHGSRDGYGLGLAIVNAVTQAHRATLITRARPEGGLSITVRFARTSQPNHP
ncbi:sensor histidine kinase [Nonomuraea longicatena]|uniref:sensor histidine kinase n=1 Tax=Nonomuraea longicatena TaxID=83682 RepID=UPI0031E3077B